MYLREKIKIVNCHAGDYGGEGVKATREDVNNCDGGKDNAFYCPYFGYVSLRPGTGENQAVCLDGKDCGLGSFPGN